MNKLNLPPFHIGQKVVYIGFKMPNGSIHTVSKIKQNSCGCFAIAINGQDWGSNSPDDLLVCTVCGEDNPAIGNGLLRGWCAASFRPIQQQNFPLMTFSKIVEKEKEEILINN